MRWSRDPLPGPSPDAPDDDDPTEVLGRVPGSILARHGARVLKPAEAAGFHGDPVPRSTIYRTRTLLAPGDLRTGRGTPAGAILERLGMELVFPEADVADRAEITTAVLRPAPSARTPVTVDAWVALQALRHAAPSLRAQPETEADAERISRIQLEHLLSAAPVT